VLNHLLRIAPAALRERAVLSKLRYDEAALGHLRITLADDPRDVAMAAHLVHDAYVGRGLIDPHPSGLKFRPQAVLPTSLTFVAKRASRVVGTVSLILDSRLGLPMEDTYGRELSELRRGGGGRLGEISALAIDPSVRHTGVLLLLIRVVFRSAIALGLDRLVTALLPRAGELFRTTLLCEPLGAVRTYEGLRGTSVALTLPLHDLRRRYEARFSRYGNTIANAAYLYFDMDCPAIEQPPLDALLPTPERSAAHAALARLRMDAFGALSDDELAFLRSVVPSVLWPSCPRPEWMPEAAEGWEVVLDEPHLQGASA
jgi:hypothetical protein